MASKFNFLVIFFLLYGIGKIHGNMCNASVGKAGRTEGIALRSSVLLRVTQYQQNCICNITIKNQLKNEMLTFRKHKTYKYATPLNDSCGLAVDMSYYPIGSSISPIKCSQNIPTYISLNKGHLLQLKSRFIEGNFTRGYCVEIFRTFPSSDTNVSLEIRCHDFQNTTQQITTTMPSEWLSLKSSSPVSTEKDEIKGPSTTTGNQSSTGVPEPCLRSVIEDSTIGTMCRASIGKEATQDGNITIDSVYLRIVTRQENCTCTVSIKNQVNTESILMRKQHGVANAAPTEDNCGLAADISYYPTGLTTITPIECTEPNKSLALRLLKGKTVKLQSRLIDGDFDRGYCMQFTRLKTNNTVNTNLLLEIRCEEPTLTAQTTITTSKSSSGSPQSTERATTHGHLTKQTTTEASTHVPTKNDSHTDNKGNDVTLYIIIGICVAVVFLAVVLFVVVRHVRSKSKCKKINNKADMKKDDIKQSNNDNGEDGLQDNILYKSFDQNDDDDGLKDNILYKSFDSETKNEMQEQTPLTQTIGAKFDDYSEIDDIKSIPKQEMTTTTHIATDHYNTIEVNSSGPNNKPVLIDDNYSTISESGPKISDNKQPKLDLEITNDNYSTIEPNSEHSTYTAAGVAGNVSDAGGNENKNTFNIAKNNVDNQNTANNVYAVVNKTDKTTSGTVSKDNTNQPDQTYTVVDKSGKKSQTNELNPKQIEPMETYAVVDKSREKTSLVDSVDDSSKPNMSSADNYTSGIQAPGVLKTFQLTSENKDEIVAHSSDYDEIELKFDA